MSGRAYVAYSRHRLGRRVTKVIQEFAHLRARRCGRTDAARVARDYAELLAPLISVSEEDLLRGLDLFERTQALGAFDAVLAAAAGTAGADALLSADAAFAAVPDLEHVVPDASGVARLLAT